MPFEPRYHPFRILKYFEVGSSDRRKLARDCRNAKRIRRKRGMNYAIYEPLQVIDVPTEFELAMLTTSKPLAAEIPQTANGIDKRDSGIARSPRTSRRARNNAVSTIVMMQNEIAMLEAGKPKPEPKPKPRPQPEKKTEPEKPEIKEIKIEPAKIVEKEEESKTEVESESRKSSRRSRYRKRDDDLSKKSDHGDDTPEEK